MYKMILSYSFCTNSRFFQPDLAKSRGKKIQTVTKNRKIATHHALSQSKFTSSESIIETPEQCVKPIQS